MYIDPHFHFRDFEEAYKETISHGLSIAFDSGVDAVFDMPNTKPATTTIELAEKRIEKAKNLGANIFYGLFIGATANPKQIRGAVKACQLAQIVGIKMYAGSSVGDLGIIDEVDQYKVYKTLAEERFEGVLCVHCEKESLLKPSLWSPENPITHCLARPEIAEAKAVKDQIKFVKKTGFKGKLHITHVSSPESVKIIARAKQEGLDISCGVCPHHLIFDSLQMRKKSGILWKMNPPLRSPLSRRRMMNYLKTGDIDWIETDHAPHTLAEKENAPHMSGIPGIAWWPIFEKFLKGNGLSNFQIADLTFWNAQKRFGLNIEKRIRETRDRTEEHAFNPYIHLKE